MEGLADVHLRRLITAQGGYDWVVSEFVRVVDRPLPDHVFHTICPELLNAGKTASGTPVRVQLLGNHLEAMASNARTAAAPSCCVNRKACFGWWRPFVMPCQQT
jgi:tRNA-dihydrouridine synthase C